MLQTVSHPLWSRTRPAWKRSSKIIIIKVIILISLFVQIFYSCLIAVLLFVLSSLLHTGRAFERRSRKTNLHYFTLFHLWLLFVLQGCSFVQIRVNKHCLSTILFHVRQNFQKKKKLSTRSFLLVFEGFRSQSIPFVVQKRSVRQVNIIYQNNIWQIIMLSSDNNTK